MTGVSVTLVSGKPDDYQALGFKRYYTNNITIFLNIADLWGGWNGSR